MRRGCVAFAVHALDSAPLPGGLSLFSTDAFVAYEGTSCRYELVIANMRPDETLQKVRVDIHAVAPVQASDGHYASFDKDFIFPSRQSSPISIMFDWREQAHFGLGPLSLTPDMFHRGTCRAPGTYAVRATLLDMDGRPCEHLTIFQRLAT